MVSIHNSIQSGVVFLENLSVEWVSVPAKIEIFCSNSLFTQMGSRMLLDLSMKKVFPVSRNFLSLWIQERSLFWDKVALLWSTYTSHYIMTNHWSLNHDENFCNIVAMHGGYLCLVKDVHTLLIKGRVTSSPSARQSATT